jgi:hypothetical protein
VPVEELVRLIRGRYKPDILIRLGKVDRLRFAQRHREDDSSRFHLRVAP